MLNTQNQNNKHWKGQFFTIALGQTVSLVGSSAVQFSLIWWLASETASPMMMALSGLLAFLPQMFLGPFAGVWIDRFKRKTVIICADLFVGLVATVFAAMFLFGKPPYWVACVVLGVRAIGNVFHTPAIQAVMPLLVPAQFLVKANGWSQFMQSGAFMLGPVLGAMMYAAFSLPVILLSDLLGAIAAVATVAAVKIPELPAQVHAAPHFWGELKDGISILRKSKRIFILILSGAACMIFFIPLATFYPLMSSDHFNVSPWHASMVELGYAAGMMVSAMLVGTFGIKHKLRVAQLGLLSLGITSLLCGLFPKDAVWFWPFAIVCALMGAGTNLYNIPSISCLQESIPPEALGRVFSLLGSLLSFTMPIGLFIAGPVAERYGVVMWFLIAGIAMIVITAISAVIAHVHKET